MAKEIAKEMALSRNRLRFICMAGDSPKREDNNTRLGSLLVGEDDTLALQMVVVPKETSSDSEGEEPPSLVSSSCLSDDGYDHFEVQSSSSSSEGWPRSFLSTHNVEA